MKTPLSYIEKVMDSCGIGDTQLTMGGISTIKLTTLEPLKSEMLREAMYRTIVKNSRLSVIIENGFAVHQAPTLDLLKPKFEIEFLDDPLTNIDLQHHTEYTINITFDKSVLPWEVKIMVYRIPGVEYEYLIYLRIGMLHTLSDGLGVVMIAKQFVEGLHEALTATEPFDLGQGVASHSLPIQSLHSVADKRFVSYRIFWLFFFLWRLFIGIVLVIANGLGYVYPFKSYSGTLDPSHTITNGKPAEKMSGFRLLEIDETTVTHLRKKANKMGGSIASVLLAAGFAAYNTVAERYQQPSTYFNASVVVNSRPLVTNTNEIPHIHGSAMYPINFELHRMLDSDTFWSQVCKLKQKLNIGMYYLSPLVRASSIVPMFIAKYIYGLASPNKPRTASILLSNVGAFNTKDLHWAPQIEVLDIIGSANSYWTGNRCLFQITSITMNGRMKLALVYPTNMVTEPEFDFFCETLRNILERAAEKDSTLMTVGEVRAPRLTMEAIDHKSHSTVKKRKKYRTLSK